MLRVSKITTIVSFVQEFLILSTYILDCKVLRKVIITFSFHSYAFRRSDYFKGLSCGSSAVNARMYE